MFTNRTPRSIIRRASRQARANEGLSGSAPYSARVALLSLFKSISSGADVCSRKAISYEAMRVAISGSPTACEPTAVQRAEQVERVALKPGIDAGRARDVEDRVALVPQADAGVDGRQEPARPVGRAAADAAAGRHHDEGGQVVRFRTEAVDHPRPQAGPARLRETRVQEDLGRRMVELVGVNRLDDGRSRRRPGPGAAASPRARRRSGRTWRT